MDAEMTEVSPGRGCDRGEVMREPDEVAAMVRLKALGMRLTIAYSRAARSRSKIWC